MIAYHTSSIDWPTSNYFSKKNKILFMRGEGVIRPPITALDFTILKPTLPLNSRLRTRSQYFKIK